MQVLIVDDENLARSRLEQLVRDINPNATVYQAASTLAAQHCIEATQADITLVLLDIEMPGGSGLDWLSVLKERHNPPAVIMTTAYSDYALPAIQQGADGYLLKPIKRVDLEDTLARVRKTHRLHQTPASSASSRICLNADGKGDYLAITDIRYCQAEERWVKVVTEQHEYISDRPLKDWEALVGEQLLRIHRSFLLNPSYMRTLRRLEGHYEVEIDQAVRLPVSRRHAQAVKTRLRGTN
ncbi:LytTR family DNA-binding domain-containing protein [Salinispirillum sp. LH 10-3-1]|uniref:LytTR family DNA-binding domain-containing protein n=1 Tax=Salinispirillum sp. LH 10-3-1 TaxID=2952525 RepID=A0AB38YHG2_9GAMM